MLVEINKELEKRGKDYSVFAVLVFTDADANLIQMLREEDYWRGLEEVTGKEILCISAGVFPPSYRYPPTRPGFISAMVKVPVEPANNRLLFDVFDIDERRQLPLLVFFADLEGGVGYEKYQLTESNPATLYAEVKGLLDVVASKIRDLEGEHREEVFRQAKRVVWETNAKKKIGKKAAEVLMWLSGFSSAKSLM